MKYPEIIIYVQQKNKVYLIDIDGDLSIGPFKTSAEAKKHIEAFAEIVLAERHSALHNID